MVEGSDGGTLLASLLKVEFVKVLIIEDFWVILLGMVT